MGALFKGSPNVFLRTSPKPLGMRSLESFNGRLQFPGRVRLTTKCPAMILERVGVEMSENVPRVLEMKYSGEGLDRNLRELEVRDKSGVLLRRDLKWHLIHLLRRCRVPPFPSSGKVFSSLRAVRSHFSRGSEF